MAPAVDQPASVGHPPSVDYPDPWPLRGLLLRTPRLELRPDDDAGLAELVAVAYQGVHPPEVMPFSEPWTDADPRDLGRGVVQYHWRARAELVPERWSVYFLVRLAGRVIGVQSLTGANFAVTREVRTGSWLGMAHQGRGYGTEMRAAVLGLAFDHLGALTARSGALSGNNASMGVSRRLGYQEDGTRTHAIRGERATETRLVVTAEEFRGHRPPWTLEVSGLEPCLALLGAG
jgi:RimJ/RimL family protein N-acetyltransferase